MVARTAEPKCEDCGDALVRGTIDRSGQDYWCPACSRKAARELHVLADGSSHSKGQCIPAQRAVETSGGPVWTCPTCKTPHLTGPICNCESDLPSVDCAIHGMRAAVETNEGQQFYVFLSRRKQDKQSRPCIYSDPKLAEAAHGRCSPVYPVRITPVEPPK